MWYEPDKYKIPLPRINEELFKLEGVLEDKVAKITLAKFLRHNLGLTTYLLTKLHLAPFQEITIKGFFNRNFSLCIWSRGASKSFSASIYSFLQCIFEPNTNILIAGPTFRTSRFIFEKIEQLAESYDGKLLAQCFGAKVRRNDLFEWKINGGSIKAIPLNGEKIRGFRANVLILDEFLLLPEEIIKTVLMPFLVAAKDIGERIKIRKIEDALIKKGLLLEKDRKEFDSNIKMIALSSASYTFENLYRTYTDWTNKIYSNAPNLDGDQFNNAKYFVSQLGYEALPEGFMEPTVIEEAKSGGVSDAIFQREYCAQFTDGSASYFSAKKMHDCTVQIGHTPHIKAVGDKKKKYIISIDPNFSNSPTADFFSMAVMELDETNQISTLIHSYAKAGVDLKHHINYFYYLITSFNPVLIITDNADGNFVQSANESEIFKRNKLEYDFFDFESDLEGAEYEKQLVSARSQYNLEAKKICFRQVFNVQFIRRANELLQTNIDRQKIFFASSINGNDMAFDAIVESSPDLKLVDENSLIDFIDTLDSNIYGTKKECALIEVKTNPQGQQTFDLPRNLKNSMSPNRPRKDRYTTLLLGNWATRCYFDIMQAPISNTRETFTPFMIK